MAGSKPDRVSTAASPTASRRPLTEARFIARSEAFCKESWQSILSGIATYRQEPKHAGMSERQLFSHTVGDVFLPSALFWYDDINSLTPPSGDKRSIARLLRTLDAATHVILHHPYSFHSPSQVAALYVRSNRVMRRYGIESCVVTDGSFPS